MGKLSGWATGRVTILENMRRLTKYRVTAVVLLPLFAGCSMLGPDYVKPEVPVPAQWSSAANVASLQDLSQWWQRLNDPQLSSLIEEAMQSSPDLRSAQAKLREARARRELASGNRFPTVTASVSGRGNRSRSAGAGYATSHSYEAGFDASWEADVFGGQRRALEAADADLGTSQASLYDTQVSLAAEVALNYVELRSFQARLAIAHDNLATQTETLQITDWRAQAGLATALDVEQARTNREQTHATIPALNTNLVQAEHRLAVLLGKPPGTLHERLATPVALPQLPEQVATGIPADTLRQRPDVRMAERRLAAETARIGEAEAERYPGFSLSGTFGWKALTLGALGGAGTVVSGVLGSVTQTLFDGGRISSRIEAQNAVQQQALAAYEKSVLNALEDVENVLVAYANSRERQATLRQAAQAARNAAQLARQRYESGITDFQKVLDTERSRLNTEDNLASSEAEGLTALIGLYKALGGGWQETDVTIEESNPS
jgi:NodT family efflux transporter outer membrane factor (OMF) lipoprotein